ncbi:MAG: MBL fold metallo-hydrolase [Candidatus Hydrogenedentes bacterium]|nr:MBL fold metallo-hydrolase [Candidatus Hydrogenedentota bacterium]
MDRTNALTFSVLGGGGEVGASCFQLSVNGEHLILDSGTHPKKEGRDALPEFSLLRRAPDAVLVSHAHQDHCGSLPYLGRQFPGIRTFTTIPTVRIMERMLHNSVSVMGMIRRERGVEDYPLYYHEDVDYTMRSVVGQPMGQPFQLPLQTPVEVTYLRAGHVLGSASILLRFPGHTVLYSGDICETDQELMPGYAQLPDDLKVDTLIVESTNGALDESKVHDYKEESSRLGEAINETIRGGGSALIPSFALGRTQEMLNIIARLQKEGKIPWVPVYASGLGRAVYELYDRYSDYLLPKASLQPLSRFERLGDVWNPRVVKSLLRDPCIIVATSGMMLENTPSAMIAEEMVKHDQHGIFFVGYLDHETLGHHLLHAEAGDPLQFCLESPAVEVRLRNIKRFHFSAHASRASLRTYIDTVQPKNVIYVHGDVNAIDWMRVHTGAGRQAYTPAIGQSITLEQ